VTDAHLVLGRIPPHLLAGELPLNPEPAREGLADLGAKLGLDLAAAAAGILEISAWNQANALRQITVQRGLDVRDFALTTFGGSGSLLLCRLIDIVGVPVGVVPRDPGNLSAFGLLTVDVKVDHVQTHVARHASLDLSEVERALAVINERAATALAAEGFAESSRQFARTADLRYFGQAFEVRVPLLDGPFTAAVAEAAVRDFHDAHEQLYGYCFRDRPEQQVEWVNLRVTGIGPIRRPPLVPAHRSTVDNPVGQRAVCFDPSDGFVRTPIYWRNDLAAGAVVTGPAVIEEYGATVPVHPGFTATVDELGNLVVRKEVS
jgi:N-methylhydantoinase A